MTNEYDELEIRDNSQPEEVRDSSDKKKREEELQKSN